MSKTRSRLRQPPLHRRTTDKQGTWLTNGSTSRIKRMDGDSLHDIFRLGSDAFSAAFKSAATRMELSAGVYGGSLTGSFRSGAELPIRSARDWPATQYARFLDSLNMAPRIARERECGLEA